MRWKNLLVPNDKNGQDYAENSQPAIKESNSAVEIATCDRFSGDIHRRHGRSFYFPQDPG